MLPRLGLRQLALTPRLNPCARARVSPVSPHPTRPHLTSLIVKLRTMSTSALPTITLTAAERALADLLTSCTDWIAHHPDQVSALRTQDPSVEWIAELPVGLEVELRVAGGWVRDKVSARRTFSRRVRRQERPSQG